MKNDYYSLSPTIILRLLLCSLFLLVEPMGLLIYATNSTNAVSSFETELNVPPVKVTGRVIDDMGEPLPGVTVVVLGTPRGVTTDIDGTFTIDVERGTKLEISFIGMKTKQITVTDNKQLVIQLEAQVDELDEVTVVAFAKQKKESVLASVSTVKPGELKVPSSNLTTALAGRIAGVISYQRSGEPGADNADFFVRGVTTFGYKQDPLILVDGVEMTSSDLSRLQVDDIASFSIMKDATATALYGSRGANGVILVTTKGGVEGPAKISGRIELSHSSPTKTAKWSNPISYMKMENEASLYTDGSLIHSPQKIANTEQGLNPNMFPAVDWYNTLFNQSTTNYRGNLNISGGGKAARYYVAGTFSKDEGNLKAARQNNFNNNISLFKYLLRTNVDVNVTKTTTATVRLHATMDDYTGPIPTGSKIYNYITQTSPVLYPAYYKPDRANETTPYVLYGNHEDGTYLNPYAEMTKGYRDTKTSLMLAQFELKQDLSFITKGLDLRAMFNTNRRSEYGITRQYKPFYYTASGYDPLEDTYALNCINPLTGTDYLESKESSKVISTNTYFESAMSYNRTFAKKHAVSGLFVFTMRDETNSSSSGDVQLSLPSRNMGLAGRFTYAFDSRYFVEGNFGYNGSERFHQTERWGFFPSAGIGYIMSNEKFWTNNLKKVINKLKFKATYGLVGNDAIGNENDRFFYLSKVNMSNTDYAYTWGSMWNHTVNGVSIDRYANPNITWEVSKKTNIGVELGLFDHFEFQVDIYRDDRSKILMGRANIPGTMGLSYPSGGKPEDAIKANIGRAMSEGIDLSLDYNQSFMNGLWLSGRFNFTYAHSKYKVYEEPDYSATPWRSRVGHSIKQSWGYVAERLFVDEDDVKNSPKQIGDYKAGDIKYKDINRDGQITSADQVPIGYPTSPEIVYGFGMSSGWKGFDLSFFFQGLGKESFWLDYKSTTPFLNNSPKNTEGETLTGRNQLLQVIAGNHWSVDNRNMYAFWPRLSTQNVDNNSQRNTWFMRDGSFLRLKSVEFGYTLPKHILRKMHLSSFRIYYSGNNLLCFSKFKLWDPEMAGNGFNYPVQRVHNIGINFSF